MDSVSASEILTIVCCEKCAKYSKDFQWCDQCHAQIPANSERFHVLKVRKKDLADVMYVQQKIVTKKFVRKFVYRTRPEHQNKTFQGVVLQEVTVVHKHGDTESLNKKAKDCRTAEPMTCALSSGEENSEISISSQPSNSNVIPDLSALSLGEENLKFSKPEHASKEISAPKVIVPSKPFAPISPNQIVKLFTYPLNSEVEGIDITNHDLACLEPRQYLNDVIIDFYLKYIFLEKLPPFHQEKIFVFNSVFYTALTKPNPRDRNVLNESIQYIRHNRVKGWTKTTDIFSKDFLIIPIHMPAHWLLAIIFYPNQVPDVINVPGIAPSTNEHVNEVTDEEMSNNYEVHSILDSNSDLPMEEDSLLTDEYSGASGYSYSEERKVPCICIFNSLSNHIEDERVITDLREYLEMEWITRKVTLKVFDENTMKGYIVNCPQQTNNFDCGLYLLQYAEQFFENPVEMLPIISDLLSWFPREKVDTKRQEIIELIRHIRSQAGDAAA